MPGRPGTDTLAAVAWIVAVCVFVTAYFAQPLLGPQTVQAVTEHGGDPDVANVFHPIHEYQYRYVKQHGVLPEWFDAMGLGIAQVDLATTTNAYLPRLAAVRVAPSAQSAADILAWAEALAGALGVLALARLYSLRWGAAALAAASYPLTHVVVRWLPYFSLPVFLAALPFVLLGVELVWRRRVLLGGAVIVAALGIGGLGGSVLLPALAIQVAAALTLYRLVVTRAPRRERILRAAATLAVLAVGLLAGSAGWLPFALSQHDTVREATTFEAIPGIDWATLGSIVDPTVQRGSEGINGDLYVSLFAPLLIGIGLVASVRRRLLGFVPFFALLLLLIGLKTPFLKVLIALVPGWSYVSSAERYVSFLAALPLALLVGIGADVLLRRDRNGVAALATMLGASVLLWELKMWAVEGWSPWVLVAGLLATVTLGALAASRTRWPAAATVAPLALLAVGVSASLEERVLAWHPVADRPEAIYRPWLGLVAGHDDPEGRWMSYCQPLEYAFDPRQSFTYRPNTFLHVPGRWLDAYFSFASPDYYAYWQRLTGSERYSKGEFGIWFQHTPNDPKTPNASLVNAAGVSRILASSACKTPPFPAWRELASTRATPTFRRDVVYANAAAYPMAYVSHRWEAVADTDEAVDRLASPVNAEFSSHVDTVQADIPPESGGSPVQALLERVSGTELRIILPPSTSRALLVVLDYYDPHWRAYVDGRRSPLRRVNGIFRGVLVSDEARAVVLRYEPWWTRWLFPLCWGLIAAALATAAAVGLRALRSELPATARDQRQDEPGDREDERG